MKTFIVAHIDFFDNILDLQKVEAESAVEACKDRIGLVDREYTDLDAVKEFAFNCDCMVNAIEI